MSEVQELKVKIALPDEEKEAAAGSALPFEALLPYALLALAVVITTSSFWRWWSLRSQSRPARTAAG